MRRWLALVAVRPPLARLILPSVHHIMRDGVPGDLCFRRASHLAQASQDAFGTPPRRRPLASTCCLLEGRYHLFSRASLVSLVHLVSLPSPRFFSALYSFFFCPCRFLFSFQLLPFTTTFSVLCIDIFTPPVAIMKLPTMSLSMPLPVILILRITQGVFALLVLSLSGFGKTTKGLLPYWKERGLTRIPVAHWYNTTTTLPSPSSINFLIFGSVWSFLSLVCIQILPRFLPRST